MELGQGRPARADRAGLAQRSTGHAATGAGDQHGHDDRPPHETRVWDRTRQWLAIACATARKSDAVGMRAFLVALLLAVAACGNTFGAMRAPAFRPDVVAEDAARPHVPGEITAVWIGH